MILCTQYVLQYVFDNGNDQDRERVDIANWRWIQNQGQTLTHALQTKNGFLNLSIPIQT